MAYQTLLLDQEDHALKITLNRPEVLNALSLELLRELKEALRFAKKDQAVRAVLLTGAGRGFCSGADLMQGSLEDDVSDIIETLYNPISHLIASMPKPVIAGVNGIAAGAGMSLALCCDVRLLSDKAAFTVGFSAIGLVMDASLSFFLPRIVGRSRALELAYSNRTIEAEEAIRLGLGETLLQEGFAEQAWALTKKLAQGPSRSFALIKEQVNASLSNDLASQLALEAKLQTEAAKTHDFMEGVSAFVQKRKPSFKGK